MKTETLVGIKAQLVRVLLGDLAYAPTSSGREAARERREDYDGMSIEELIAAIDRRMTAANARVATMRNALRIVASGGRSIFDKDGGR